MNERTDQDQWWIAPAGDSIVWARLRVLDSGVAEIFGAQGETLRYEDEDSARAALLDADFAAFDGLDEDDAAFLGYDLESLAPPEAESEEELVALMSEKILRGHGR